MAADQHIHIFEGLTEDDLALFFSSTMGSKWFNLDRQREKSTSKIYDKIAKTPQVHVGEVSWLKAGLFEDSHTYIPPPIQRIAELIPEGEDPVLITPELIEEVSKALHLPNTTPYHIEPAEEILTFLRQHTGKKAFTVSW